jgi:diguanylate cyclase (GGDEF)-like protein
MKHDFSQLHADTVFTVLERKRVFDAAWIVCWVSLLSAVAVPWFLRVLAINLDQAAWFVFGSALAYLLLATITDRLRNQPAVIVAMRVMPLASIVLMGPLWHLVGGLQNPVFLAAFVLPVILSGVSVVGRQAQATALLSVIVAFTVGMTESPELRWYIAGGTPWVWKWLDAMATVLPARTDVFPEVWTSPAYQFTILTTFTVMQFLVAFLATPFAVLLRRLDTRLQFSHELFNEVQGLFHAVLAAEPDPSVIVYADSGQIVQASDSFFKRMQVRPSQIGGRNIFSIVNFDQSETLRGALSAEHGEVPFCVYRVQGEVRIANLYFHRTEHRGTPYIYIGWQELTELFYLQSAFNAIDDLLVVVGADAGLLYANRTARGLFGDLALGTDATTVPGLGELLQDRADPAEGESRTTPMIQGRPYEVHRRAALVSNEFGPSTIVWLRCVEKEQALFEQAVRDPMTGAYNRRYFNEALERHVVRDRRGQPHVCAYFDLDNFKPINDTYGHDAGDAAILAFVRTARGQLRSGDVFARLGGDEFAALFVNCDLHTAASVVERIRGILDVEGWTLGSRKGPLTFSSGLAACHPDDNVERLLKRTDQAVYAAKAAGKGRSATEE